MVDEDAPHVARGHGEEVDAVLVGGVLAAGETQERLGDQLGRAKRMVGPFAAHVGGGEAAELVVDDRREAAEGALVAAGPGPQESGDPCLPGHDGHGARGAAPCQAGRAQRLAQGNFARPARSAWHRHAGPCALPGAFQRHDKGVHMAGVDVAASGGHRRATNSDLNMIPFIDLLMCTIAFLLITAVWTTSARIRADAQVPGGDIPETPPVERVLHVGVTDRDFSLVWKHGGTVLSETHVPRPEAALGAGGAARYPELAKAIQKEWTQYREHFDAADRHFDTAVIHTDDHAPFSDIVAVLDAVGATRREIRAPGGEVKQVPAFNPTFAAH